MYKQMIRVLSFRIYALFLMQLLKMDFSRQIRNIHFLWFLIFAQITAEEYFVLRNKETQLVIDASEDFVTVMDFTGFSSQQWRLEPALGGTYYIINKRTGKLMDVDYRYPVSNSRVVVSNKMNIPPPGSACLEKNSTLKKFDACQRWYIHYDGSIVNACGNYAVDVRGGKPGSYLETWGSNRSGKQQFRFQYV